MSPQEFKQKLQKILNVPIEIGEMSTQYLGQGFVVEIKFMIDLTTDQRNDLANLVGMGAVDSVGFAGALQVRGRFS